MFAFHQKNRIFTRITAIALIFFWTSLISSCSYKDLFRKCTFQFKKIEIKGMDFSSNKIKGLITLTVKNPNWIPLNVKSLECKLYLGGNEVIEGNITESIKLPAHEKIEIEIPFKASYANFSLEDLKSLFLDKNKVSVSGQAVIGTLFINAPVAFEIKKNIKKLV